MQGEQFIVVCWGLSLCQTVLHTENFSVLCKPEGLVILQAVNTLNLGCSDNWTNG